MNLMVLRFGHLIAPFKERIFNRKMHYNLVKLLARKKKLLKRKTRKATLKFHIIKERKKHTSYIIVKFTKPKPGGFFFF